jgi:ATP-binding cassette subfamily B protein
MIDQKKMGLSTGKAMRRLFAFLSPYNVSFYCLIFLTLLLGAMAPLQPYLVQLTIDRYIALGDYRGLTRMAALLVGLVALQSIAQYCQTYLADWLGQNVVKDIRVQLYAHVLRLRTRFLNETPIGLLVTRCISDTENLAKVFGEGMAALAGDLLQMLFMAVLMFFINWRLALLSLATMPLMLLLTYVFKEKIKTAFSVVGKSASNLNAFTQERIVGMNMVQIFGREQQEFARFKALNERVQNAGIKAVQYYARYFPLLSVINATSISLLIWYGTQCVMQGTATLGQLVAFLMYINLFFRPLHLIADRFNTLQMGVASMERILGLLENGEEADNRGTYIPKQLQGAIAFEKVWFAYKGEHHVLKDISFHIPPKKSLAIVGTTGAGKSTLVNLLERFYEVQKGAIRIDGVNIQDYALQPLRQQVGLVAQDVFLFSGTVHENITLKNSAISRERVMEATKLIGMHDFITQLPGGYGYNVMERGMTLSMGQRQLLAFARVLVYDPAILLLDEATASMDRESERLIQKATATLMRDRTCILIAHRLATIQHADNIVLLKNGQIQEEGTHQELLARGGHYAALYQPTSFSG